MKLGAIAELLGCQLEGDAAIEIHGIAGIEHAASGQLTFVSNPLYRAAMGTTLASAVIAGRDTAFQRQDGLPPLGVLRSANPYLDFARAIELFYRPPRYLPGIHSTAVIHPSAQIGP